MSFEEHCNVETDVLSPAGELQSTHGRMVVYRMSLVEKWGRCPEEPPLPKLEEAVANDFDDESLPF